MIGVVVVVVVMYVSYIGSYTLSSSGSMMVNLGGLVQYIKVYWPSVADVSFFMVTVSSHAVPGVTGFLCEYYG